MTKPRPPCSRGKPVIKVNAMSQAHLVKLLWENETMSCAALAEESGLAYVTVLQYTRELHRVGAAHISVYLPDTRGHDMVKVYKLGPGIDAKRFALTNAEVKRASRARKKAAALQSDITAALTLRPNLLPLTEIETA